MQNEHLVRGLVGADLIDRETGARLLQEAANARRSVEEVVSARNLVSEVDVAKVKSRLLKVPYRAVDVSTITEAVFGLIPAETAKAYGVTPLSYEGNMLVIGMVNPDDQKAQDALRFLAKQRKVTLGVYVVTPSDVRAALQKFSVLGNDITAALETMNLERGGGASSFQPLVNLDEDASGAPVEAPVIRIVAALLKEAVRARASDLHIEPQRTRLRVRLRIDGALEEHTSLPAELSSSVVSRVKVLANLRLDESRVPQDGRFRTIIFEKEIDFRVAVFPGSNGEKVALRVLDPAVGVRSLEDIGISAHNAEILKESIEKPYGMVLLTGPTGSGKTTTLYALMAILNKEEVNIVSLEDPVEYTIDGVNQSQVRPEIGYSFASGLRQILRQDPDVIMVGEVRDSETAELAVHASLTGHVVLSTLHTNNALGVIPRLLDMSISAFLLPSSLSVMAAQRLVTKLCQACKEPEETAPGVAKIIEQEIERLPENMRRAVPASRSVFRARGCQACKGKGIEGRTALFEVFKMTAELGKRLSRGEVNEGVLREERERQGMVTLRQDGILKSLAGVVSIAEVLRETEET